MSMSDLNQLKEDIERKLREFEREAARLQISFENTIIGLSKKGYKIEKDRIKEFMGKFWLTYPTKNTNEWEVAVPVFIPFNIGWFDRTEGGYNVFVVNKYTKWLGEELPAFITHEVNLPPSLNITVDGDTVTFEEDQ